jgi:hypothetical protein
VNLSDGERRTVDASSATPIPDAIGPVIANVKVDSVTLTAGHTIVKPAAFTLNASDPSGVSRVEFFIDGALLRTDYNGSPNYNCYWDILTVSDGNHIFAITAYDSLGNTTSLQYPLVVDLAPPAAPNITYPLSGLVTNQAALTVRGTGEKGAEILLYNNGVQAAGPSAVDSAGLFSIPFTLSEGQNLLKAVAQNRGGTGPFGRPGGVIRLSWSAPTGGAIQGYNLYRSSSSFSSISQAQKVNSTLLTVTTYDNLPSQDGTYFYRVTSVSNIGNESDPSGEASAPSDRTMPRVLSVVYTPSGHYDPQTGRMAPGTVSVRLTLSEPLQSTPFFSITPEGGVPVTLTLSKVSDVEYSGLFAITDATPTGIGYAVFSGRDLVENRGTEIDAGGTVLIDTNGPAVSRILIEPETPIRNDHQNPVTITVTIGLTEPVNPGDAPEFTYLLSGEGRDLEAIEPLTQVTPQAGEAQAWQGVFTLPADAGLNEAETFQFAYTGADDLANVSQEILCINLFQVYQGALPPLSPPLDLKAESLPGGAIRLNWSE